MFEYILYSFEITILIVLNYLLFKRVKSEKNIRYLIIFNFSIILWILSTILILFFNTDVNSVWFVRTTFAATTISLASFLVFLRSYMLDKIGWLSKIFVVSSVFNVLLSFSDLYIAGLNVASGARYPAVEYGPIPFVYVIFIAIGILICLGTIFLHRKNLRGIQYLRMRYTLTGLVFTGIIAIFTNVVLPIITHQANTSFWGTVAVSTISITTSYAILNKRLFSVKYLLKRIIFYLIKLSLLVGSYLAIVSFADRVRNLFSDIEPIAIIIILIAIFSFVYTKAIDLIKKRFFKNLTADGISREQLKEEYVKKISVELNLDKITLLSLGTLKKVFNISQIGIILFDKNNTKVLYKKIEGIDEQNFNMRDLLQSIFYWDEQGHSSIIVREELEQVTKGLNPRLARILYFLQKNDLAVVLPLNRNVQLNGVVVLGNKKDIEPYTAEDIEFLSDMILSSSVAFGRSILYKQVQEFNASLQSKVNEQTKELQIKVKELQEARRKEADMIDIMGHELRTPATVVKLNAELLSKFTDKVTQDPEQFKKYLDRIKVAVENEIKLINTLLSSAKLEGDKIVLNPEEINIEMEIEMSMHAHEREAESKGLALTAEIEEGLVPVYADKARVIEVLNNLISNAVKYTHKGGVTVAAKDFGSMVQISVIDTGEGISKEDINNLGKKFYRATNYIESDESDDFDIVRPGGTGLGLYVTFNLVKKMGGDIRVESEIGKGSKFIFTLPKYAGQKINKPKSNDMFERLGLKK